MSETAAARRPYIRVVDLETTGLDRAEGHVPIELGWCDVVGACNLLGAAEWCGAMCTGPSSVLIAPGRPIPPESSAIHHLIDDDLAAACDWQEVIAGLAGDPAAFAAHNAQMEQQWLTPDLTGTAAPWIDTWKCALRAWPDAPGHSNQCLRYWRRPAGLCRALAMPAHRAGPDAYVTAWLLAELLREHDFARLVEWSAEPAILVRVPFGKPPEQGGSRGLKWTEVDDGLIEWVLRRDFGADILHTARVERDRRAAAARALAARDDGEEVPW
jgi:exodeoxyribonuclease X